jgi:hypothetical protein
MAINLNRKTLSLEPVNVEINRFIERTHPPRENRRQYLGASSIGTECLRRIQFDWMVDSKHTTQTLDRFARGNFFEAVSREHLIHAGFVFRLQNDGDHFETGDGQFRGHADGILIDGPTVTGLIYPCIWEHKCLASKGFKDIERDGLEAAYAHYAIQVWIYQAYLDLTNPALVTIVKADSCERLHLLLPFDVQRAQLWSDRAAEIIRATRAGELLPKFTDNPHDWRCLHLCGHLERCRRYR